MKNVERNFRTKTPVVERSESPGVFRENFSVEFKGTRVRPESLAKEMEAFANTNGGLIFIGVDDTG